LVSLNGLRQSLKMKLSQMNDFKNKNNLLYQEQMNYYKKWLHLLNDKNTSMEKIQRFLLDIPKKIDAFEQMNLIFRDLNQIKKAINERKRIINKDEKLSLINKIQEKMLVRTKPVSYRLRKTINSLENPKTKQQLSYKSDRYILYLLKLLWNKIKAIAKKQYKSCVHIKNRMFCKKKGDKKPVNCPIELNEFPAI